MDSDQFRIIDKKGHLRVRNPKRRFGIWDLYHNLLRMGWFKFFVIFTTSFISINMFFGSIYFSLPSDQFLGFREIGRFRHFLECFFFSVQTFGTIGYGGISPIGIGANVFVTLECYSSLFVVAILTGLVFARFSKPNSKIIFSHHAVIREFDGVPCFMFRLANERQNHITDAKVTVALAYFDPVTRFRNFHDMKLERELSPLFSLSWTVAHDIDHDSPIARLPLSKWKECSAEVIVTFSGIDTTLSQQVYAKSSYLVDEVLCNYDFEDVVKRAPDGYADLDLKQFNEVKVVPGSKIVC